MIYVFAKGWQAEVVLRKGWTMSGRIRNSSARQALCLNHGRRGTGKMREKMPVLYMIFIRDVNNPGYHLPDKRSVIIVLQALTGKVIR